MEQLTDQTRIKGFLKRLLNQRSLLTLKLAERPEDFTTMILGLEPEQNQLLIDALQPGIGNNLLSQSARAVIRGNLEGTSLSFEAKLIETKIENNLPLHILAIPAVMGYLQRRETIRIKLGAAHPVPVELSAEKSKKIQGLIRDISAGGLGVQVDKPLPAGIEPGQEFECSFHLPMEGKQLITCDVIIRIVKPPIPGQAHSFIGVQFIDLPKPQQRLIEKDIMNLQRLAQQRKTSLEDDDLP